MTLFNSLLVNKRVALLALLVTAFALIQPAPPSASAHANQIRTSPAPDSELETSPERIIVWFSEPVEPDLSKIRVLNADGDQIDNEDSVLSPTEPTAVVVTLPTLENGTYTAVWKNVSSVDGHTVVGSFRFAVGEPLSEGSATLVEQPLLQSGVDPLMRWIFFVGALSFTGALLFEVLVVTPALGSANAGTAGNRLFIRFTRMLPSVLWSGIALAAIGLVSLVIQQASVTFDVGIVDTLGDPLRTVLLDTEWGIQWIWRMSALVAGAILLALARSVGGAASRSDDDEPIAVTETVFGQLALAAGLGVLFLTSFTSHNAASPEALRMPAIISDFIHIVAAAAWFGGLFFMALSLRGLLRNSDPDFAESFADMLPRFSTVAIVSAGTLIVTGIFSGWMQITVPEATATPYGWAMVAKLLLLVPLFGIAAVNSFVLTRRLMCGQTALSALAKLVSAEAVIGLLVLLAVGWMAGLEPARQYASRHGIGVDEFRSFTDTAEGTQIRLEVEPGNVGLNTVRVQLADIRGRSIDNASEVRVRLRFLEDDLAEPTLSLEDGGDGLWSLGDFRLGIAGIYQAEIVVVRPDAFDARTAFRFEAASTGGASGVIAPTRTPTWILFGVELLIVGTLVMLAATPLLRRARKPSLALAAPGGALAALGLVLVLNAAVLRVGFEKDEFNPFAPTPSSLERGEIAYTSQCSECHGERGYGDGTLAASLESPPADLTIHVPLHTDGDLFGFIRDGIPGTVMSASEGILSDEEMWHIVNYLRTFE